MGVLAAVGGAQIRSGYGASRWLEQWMNRSVGLLVVLLAVVTGTGCGSGTPATEPDAAADAATDSAGTGDGPGGDDTAPDVRSDTEPDVLSDAEHDVLSDAEPDGEADAAPDTPADAPVDAPSDGETDADAGCVPVEGTPLFDLPYVTRGEPAADALTRLDVYPPPEAGCGRPVLIWVHGGAWSVGDKANEIDNKVAWANARGAVLVSINYRLSSVGGDVQHPDHVNDMALALRWVVDNAAAWGGAPDRVALLGHSAGAHLVALAATNPAVLDAVGLSAANVTCVGSFDSEYTVSEIVARDAAYEEVFTDDPAVWADASPSAHVRSGLPGMALACRGTPGRVAQCEAFAEALREAGNAVTVIDASSLTHEQVNDRIGAPGDEVMTPAIDAFLLGCGL